MAHGGRRRGAMPVANGRRDPDDIPGGYILTSLTFFLNPAFACRNDQQLPGGMGMPGRARTRGEIHLTQTGTRGLVWRQ